MSRGHPTPPGPAYPHPAIAAEPHPHAAGQTDIEQLAPLCWTHNHTKEADGWVFTPRPDGTRRWKHQRTGLVTTTPYVSPQIDAGSGGRAGSDGPALDHGVAIVLHRRYGALMPRTISQRELRNDSGAIMRALDRGEVFLVTRNGIPVGELRPARRRFVSRDLLLEAFASAPGIDAERFREELDEVLDQAIEPRA